MLEEVKDRKDNYMFQMQEEPPRNDPIACNLDFLIEEETQKEDPSKGKPSSKHFIKSRALLGEIKLNSRENIGNNEINHQAPIKVQKPIGKQKHKLSENEFNEKINAAEIETTDLQQGGNDLTSHLQSIVAKTKADMPMEKKEKNTVQEDSKEISKKDKNKRKRDKKANYQKTLDSNHHISTIQINASDMEPGELDLTHPYAEESHDFKTPKPQQTVAKEVNSQANGNQSSVEISSLAGLDKMVLKNKSDFKTKSSNNSMDNSLSSLSQMFGVNQDSSVQNNVQDTPNSRENSAHPRSSEKWNRNKRKKKSHQNHMETPQRDSSAFQIEDGYEPSEPMKKLLDMPLNVLQNLESKAERTNERLNNFAPRSQNYSYSANSSNTHHHLHNHQPKTSTMLNLTIPYSERCYSDRLQLEEQYLEDKLTPISKTFQDSMLTATELQNSIQRSLLNFENSLKEAKLNFLRLQSATDLKLFPTRTEPKLFQTTEKKDNLNVTPERVLRLFQTPSTNSPTATGTDSKDVHLLYSDSTKSSNSVRHLDQEASQDIKLYETLQSVFELNTFEPGQIQAIKTILKKQSCLYRCVRPIAKSVVYKLSAILTKGFVVYVSSSINYMTEQIQSLPSTLLGACYNNLISHEKSKQIQELVKIGEVKILFITIERIINDQKFQIPTPDFVIFDEPHLCYEISSNYKLTHKNFDAILKKRFKSSPILAIVPQITTEEAFGVCQKFGISTENVYPLDVAHYSRPHITISRDEEPAKAIVALLNNVKFTERYPVIIYVEGKKTAEELSENLLQNGIASQIYLSSKPEIQKLQIIGNFTKQNPPFLIVPSGTDIGIDRSLVKRTIHYNLPKSAEILAQEVLSLNEDAHCHVFLSDDDYYKARVNIFSDSVDKSQINKFVEKILETRNKNQDERNSNETNALTGNKRRRDGTEVNSNTDSTLQRIMGTDANPFLSKGLQQPQNPDPIKNLPQGVYSTKVSEMIRHLNLRKDQMMIIFESLEATGDWLKFLGINPLVCSIQINPNKSVNFDHNLIIQHLAKKPKRSRIQIPELSNELNLSIGETLRNLRM